jgi:hypothetical protein
VVAGVPPDYFNKTGQLWGNPLYNWERMPVIDVAHRALDGNRAGNNFICGCLVNAALIIAACHYSADVTRGRNEAIGLKPLAVNCSSPSARRWANCRSSPMTSV